MPALVLPVELDLHEADGKKLVLERLQAELVTHRQRSSGQMTGTGSGDFYDA
jgi:hypothetical protein